MRRIARITIIATLWMAVFLDLSFLIGAPHSTKAEQVALHALSHLGVPYVFNTESEESMDCSGLIMHCYAPLGFEIDHSAEIIGTNPDYMSVPCRFCLMVGDIVCFDTVKDSDPCDHVGIWIGGNRFVHASSKYKKVVVSELKDYYLEHYTGAKRLLCPLA